MLIGMLCFFFFNQKTAYEMRISDWSSDVCSSDLLVVLAAALVVGLGEEVGLLRGQLGLRLGQDHVQRRQHRRGVVQGEADAEDQHPVQQQRQHHGRAQALAIADDGWGGGRVHLVEQFLPRINMDEREYSKTRPLPSVAAASGDAPSVSIGVDPWPKTHSARSTTTPALLMEWRVDRLRSRRKATRRW